MNVKIEGVTLIHMDYLSQLTERTLKTEKTFLQLKLLLRKSKRIYHGPRTKICPNHSRFESQVKCDKSIGTGFSKKKISTSMKSKRDNQQQNHQKLQRILPIT
jgi:hypothetical protein